MRRARGFTLMEILVAMALTTIVTASVLALVRTQLMTFELNDQVVRMQQNERAAMDFVETAVRRACGGVNQGAVGVNVAGVTPNIVPCLKIYDGATVGGTTISTGTYSSPDALEVIYGTGTITALAAQADLTSSSTITVKDTSNFSIGDYVLMGDMNNANLYRVGGKNATTLTFDAPTATTPTALVSSGTAPINKMPIGTYVLKAATYTFFVVPATTNASGGLTLYSNTLMVDPNGVASTNHLDYTSSNPKVQPAIEGVLDFQLALGQDSAGSDGVITENTGSPGTDEWLGNAPGELSPWPTATLDPNTHPWNPSSLSTQPQLRQVRVSLIVQTMNKYAGGSTANLPKFEDQTTLPTTSANGNPRYRAIRMIVAPRAWNLAE
jgi:prepilin-type N-terminal cleavage/methylation domain-containing protein